MSIQVDNIMAKFSHEQGWNKQTQLDICMSYIANQQSDEAFKNHCQEYADSENECEVS